MIHWYRSYTDKTHAQIAAYVARNAQIRDILDQDDIDVLLTYAQRLADSTGLPTIARRTMYGVTIRAHVTPTSYSPTVTQIEIYDRTEDVGLYSASGHLGITTVYDVPAQYVDSALADTTCEWYGSTDTMIRNALDCGYAQVRDYDPWMLHDGYRPQIQIVTVRDSQTTDWHGRRCNVVALTLDTTTACFCDSEIPGYTAQAILIADIMAYTSRDTLISVGSYTNPWRIQSCAGDVYEINIYDSVARVMHDLLVWAYDVDMIQPVAHALQGHRDASNGTLQLDPLVERALSGDLPAR